MVVVVCKQDQGIVEYQAGGEPGLTKVRARACHPALGQDRGRIVAVAAMDEFDHRQLEQKCNLVDLKSRPDLGSSSGRSYGKLAAGVLLPQAA